MRFGGIGCFARHREHRAWTAGVLTSAVLTLCCAARRLIQPIQSLRAIAALAVVAMHIPEDLAVRGYGDLPRFAQGAFGVDLFFVISGFIMVYASRHLFGREGAGDKEIADALMDGRPAIARYDERTAIYTRKVVETLGNLGRAEAGEAAILAR